MEVPQSEQSLQPARRRRFVMVAALVTFVTGLFVVGLVVFFTRLYPADLSRAATITWTGEAGDGKWETAGNWSGSAVPTASDDVTIVSTSTLITVTLSSGQTADFSSLTVGGDVLQTTFVLEGNIGTGGNIILGNAGILEQKNLVTQTVSGTLTIQSGGTLTHTGNTSEQSYIINLVAQTIDLQAGGTISVTGKGYGMANSGPGYGITQSNEGVMYAGGGAHGGNGATNNLSPGGVAYCTVTNITTMGSPGGLAGGESFSPGHGAGGGLAVLRSVATTTLSGSIEASGAAGATLIDNTYSSGGGGGGVRITAGKGIAGTPTAITADGGAGFGEASVAGGGGCIQLSYHTSNTVTALSDTVTVDAGDAIMGEGHTAGLFYVAQTNTVPTTAVTSVVQSNTSTVTFVASVTDVDLDGTSLIVEHSLDGVNWASSTLGSVTASQGSVSTSTGRISGIATTISTTTLTAVWNVGVDAPTITTSTAYMRFVPTDGVLVGSVATSTVFTIVTIPPSDFTITSVTDHEANFTWTASTSFSSYYIQDADAAFSSDWIAASPYQLTNLTCGTAYSFSIKGKSAVDVETSFSSSIATTTLNCGPSFSVGGGGGSAAPAGDSAAAPAPVAPAPTPTDQPSPVPAPAPTPVSQLDFLLPSIQSEIPLNIPLPSVPLVLTPPVIDLPPQPPAPLADNLFPSVPVLREQVEKILQQEAKINEAIAETAQVFTPPLRTASPVTIGSEAHTVTVAEASPERIIFTLRSTPITLMLKNGEEREADTNGDKIPDVLVVYKGFLDDKPLLSLAPLIDQAAATAPFAINNGALQTGSADVTLLFNSSNVRAIQVSNFANFASSTYFSFASSTRWRLPQQAGVATVHVRLFKNDGTVFGLTDSIFVRPVAIANWSTLVAKTKAPAKIVFKLNLKMGSKNTEVRLLQTLLQGEGFYPPKQAVTGNFQQVTRAAVVALQKKYGLVPIGEVGPQTRALLNTIVGQKKY